MNNAGRYIVRRVYVPPRLSVYRGVTASDSLMSNSLDERDEYGNGGDPFSQEGNGAKSFQDFSPFTDYVWEETELEKCMNFMKTTIE